MSKKNYRRTLFNNNDIFIPKRKYKPLKYIIRELNPDTEQYEYIEKIQNLELELENENEILKDLNIEAIMKGRQ